MDRKGNLRRKNDFRRGAPIEYKVKMPGPGEVAGVVTKVAGATNFLVKCNDNKERLCTIPGRLRRMFWIKAGDIVLVKPWIVQSDERGDIIWRYSQMDAMRLKERGVTSNL